MKPCRIGTIALTAFALTATAALADWYNAAELATSGAAKAVTVNFRDVRAVRLQWVDGDVEIESLGVRSTGGKEEFRVGRRLENGNPIVMELDGRDVTGFRVADRGDGRYRIDVLSEDAQYYYEHHHHHHHRLPPEGRHGVHPGKNPAASPDGGRADSGLQQAAGKTDTAKTPGEVKPPSPKDAPKAPPKKTPKKAPKKAPSRRGPPKGR